MRKSSPRHIHDLLQFYFPLASPHRPHITSRYLLTCEPTYLADSSQTSNEFDP